MEKYAPKFSKVLLTPDPHYIPGYAGYCPQLKFNMGKSYSQLTAELLTSPDVKHSSRLVIPTDPVRSTVTADTAALTLRGIPDSNLKKVIPGYTGRYITLTQAMHVSTVSCHLLAQRPTLPLTAITNEVISYKPLKPFVPSGKPYHMEDDNPHKYFISGFTGHVPKCRSLIGKGYPITTNQALIQFGKQQQSDPTSHDTAGRKDSSTPPMPTIYPSNRGVVPSFTGHIPGYQFMYGHTFGQLSQNALEKSGIKRTLREKS
uniref:Ciliary microtubule inner protein 2B n=1 Tax=Seriola lalandi dorsalis TaxID=1841481 RepID=A0A3B4Y0S3_SERLL